MQIKNRQAALCIFRREGAFLVAENTDPDDGHAIHRPPGGGIEEGETPEQAVRRELMEELGIALTQVELLGSIDHVWYWKSREVHERAFLFAADGACDERIARGETPELLEADGLRSRTLWLPLDGPEVGLPPVCPAGLREFLRQRC